MSRIALLPSPFLGWSTWWPVADLLSGAGRTVTVVDVHKPQSVAEVLGAMEEQLPREPGLVLVPHSNAGLYVAALAARRSVSAIVFVDALLPGPTASTPVAPAGLAAEIAGNADSEGLLPPWTSWWGDEGAELFPDAAARRRVESAQPRLPATYLHESVPTPTGWEVARTAYLGFGDTYIEEITEATRRGWPVRTIPGRHLHMLVDPAAVARTVLELAASSTPP